MEPYESCGVDRSVLKGPKENSGRGKKQTHSDLPQLRAGPTLRPRATDTARPAQSDYRGQSKEPKSGARSRESAPGTRKLHKREVQPVEIDVVVQSDPDFCLSQRYSTSFTDPRGPELLPQPLSQLVVSSGDNLTYGPGFDMVGTSLTRGKFGTFGTRSGVLSKALPVSKEVVMRRRSGVAEVLVSGSPPSGLRGSLGQPIEPGSDRDSGSDADSCVTRVYSPTKQPRRMSLAELDSFGQYVDELCANIECVVSEAGEMMLGADEVRQRYAATTPTSRRNVSPDPAPVYGDPSQNDALRLRDTVYAKMIRSTVGHSVTEVSRTSADTSVTSHPPLAAPMYVTSGLKKSSHTTAPFKLPVVTSAAMSTVQFDTTPHPWALPPPCGHERKRTVRDENVWQGDAPSPTSQLLTTSGQRRIADDTPLKPTYRPMPVAEQSVGVSRTDPDTILTVHAREGHLLRRHTSATTGEDRAQLRSTSAQRGTIVDALSTSMLWPREDAKPSKGTFRIDSVEHSTTQEAPKSAAAGRWCADAFPVMNPSRDLERVEVQRDANVRQGHVLSAASQSHRTSVPRDMVDDTPPTSRPRPRPAAELLEGAPRPSQVVTENPWGREENMTRRQLSTMTGEQSEVLGYKTGGRGQSSNLPTFCSGIEDMSALFSQLVQQETQKRVAAGKACADVPPVPKSPQDPERNREIRDLNVRQSYVPLSAPLLRSTSVQGRFTDDTPTTSTHWPPHVAELSEGMSGLSQATNQGTRTGEERAAVEVETVSRVQPPNPCTSCSGAEDLSALLRQLIQQECQKAGTAGRDCAVEAPGPEPLIQVRQPSAGNAETASLEAAATAVPVKTSAATSSGSSEGKNVAASTSTENRRQFLKLGHYDGRTEVEAFARRFEACARRNCWDEEEKLDQLMCALV